MTWLRMDDRAFGDPAFASVSRDAQLLHIEALVWTMAHDATGHVARNLLRRITSAEDPDELAAELVAAGIWRVSRSGGWRLVYLMDDQPSAEEIARQKEYNRLKAKRSRRHKAGDHSLCDPNWCREAARIAKRGGAEEAPRIDRATAEPRISRSSVTGNDTRDVTGVVPDPVPSRPEGKGKGKGPRSDSPSATAPGSSPLAGRRRRPMSPEHRRQISESVRRANEEKRAREEADARRSEEEREQREAEQRARDEEWLGLGGSPDMVPVSEPRLRAKREGRTYRPPNLR